MPKLIDNAVVPVSVTVTVADNGDVDIKCYPNPVPVNGFSTLIAFHLDTRGYRFRTIRAIELDKPEADFPYPSWTVTPTLATLYDLCNNEDIFKYTVNVVNTLTDEEFSVDPEIKNGGVGNGRSKAKGKSAGKAKAKSKR